VRKLFYHGQQNVERRETTVLDASCSCSSQRKTFWNGSRREAKKEIVARKKKVIDIKSN
jgi:hypothetical protein